VFYAFQWIVFFQHVFALLSPPPRWIARVAVLSGGKL